MATKYSDISDRELDKISYGLSDVAGRIIDQSRRSAAYFLNSQVAMTYWRIGKCLADEIDRIGSEKYGTKIVSTVSTQLVNRFGRAYNRVSVSRMVKIAKLYPDKQMMSTLSAQLSWSHLIELSFIPDANKRLFYQQMSILNHWSIRSLREQEDAMAYERTLVAAKPEEEQKRILSKVTEGEVSPDVILKNSYVVDFLGLDGDYSEAVLEDAIVRQMVMLS